MKKVGVLIIFVCFVLSLGYSIAQVNNSTTNNSDVIVNNTDTEVTLQQDQTKIEQGFSCLEEKVEGKCDTLTTTEIALTILASPKKEVAKECVSALKDKEKSENCWGKSKCAIKDTALAILALEHVSENTNDEEKWLINQNITPDELIWYLEQDSNEASECHISYDSDDYTINVGENKKIDKSAGACLPRAQSNFWLRIAPSCLNKEFKVACDKKFIATLLYKNKNSATIYVLEDTESAQATGTIDLKVKSKCFPKNSGEKTCDYEASAWAALALLKTRNDVEEYIPYVIALADTNKRYLPEAFIYGLTNYEDYGNRLIETQKLGNYWEAAASSYNKYYDTALALLVLSDSSSENVIKAKNWALFSQGKTGCWGNSVRDTAIMLWALEGRSSFYSGGGSGDTSTTYCSEANFFCIPETDCPASEKLDNYFCSGLSSVCCENENLKSCEEYGGAVCNSTLVCIGNEKRATDTDSCCIGSCEERQSQQTECESKAYVCKPTCSEDQEEIGYDCNSGDVCCQTIDAPSGGSSWWIWLLIILILIVIGVIIYIKREQLKPYWYKIKSKFSKGKGGKSSSGPTSPGSGLGFQPRGIPQRPMPLRRQPIIPNFQKRPIPKRVQPKQDKSMDETFKKLQEMSK